MPNLELSLPVWRGTANLQISDSISLPLNAVTQTLACIGRKGAGKTYLAQLIAELMLDARAQIVAIDAVGNWYGLRVGSDGKSKGKDIFIAGGEHGDVPILPTAGARFAKLVVEKNIPIILDVSGFRQNERKRFAADFGEEFFHLKKKQKSAVHLFIEEAQLFVPQRVGPEEARMLGAFENIIRLGRNYGIGATMISQRPQSVNKEVLSQVECLCVLQVNGSHERKALEEWVQEAGADRKIVNQLPGLNQGEGFVWSPSWLRVFDRVRFGQKTTFDASATPEVGRAAKTAMLSAMDVAALRSDLEAIIRQAEEDDPATLRKRIRELEAEIARATTDHPVIDMKPDSEAIAAIVKGEVQSIVDTMYAAVRTHIVEVLKNCENDLHSEADLISKRREIMEDPKQWTVQALTKNGEKAIASVRMLPASGAPRLTHGASLDGEASSPVMDRVRPSTVKSGASTGQNNGLSGPEQRILDAIAWMESIGVPMPEQPAVAFLAGYTFGSGAFNNPRGHLNQMGLIQYLPGGKIMLTDAGSRAAQFPPKNPTTEELHRRVLEKLPGPEQRILTPLIVSWPKSLSNRELAKQSGYTEGSGAFNNPRGRLRSLGLIDYPQPGYAVARDLLFPNVSRNPHGGRP